MRYLITHHTEYHYQESVTLQPHLVRLRPRMDGHQQVHSVQLTVQPAPQQQSHLVDLDGNTLIKLWFDRQPTNSLSIQVDSDIETLCTNPFNYLLEPWALHLPFDYPTSLRLQLQPYLLGQISGTVALDPIATQLAQEIWLAVNGHPTSFLSELNARIYKECQYQLRETGAPLPPSMTWLHKTGTCRDFAVLFIEVCRAAGLAARFVSGYQEGDLDSTDRHLHAWAEVYLPGAGWRGYDPTHGLAVSDRHMALVASAASRYAAPIEGAVNPGQVQSTMTYTLTINSAD